MQNFPDVTESIPLEQRLLTIRQARQFVPVGLTKVYELINDKRLDARKVDGRTLITGRSIKSLMDSLPPVAA